MTDIQPRYLSLDGLLTGRLFRIPQYQRNYSWTKKQRDDLFGDILQIRGDQRSRSHFMATVVGLESGKTVIATREHQVVDVVDGQQRLTTLILLLKSLSKALAQRQQDNPVAKELEQLLVKPDRVSSLLLQTNHDSSNYFQNYLRTGEHPESSRARTLADKELLRAIEECESFVTEHSDDVRSSEDLVSLLRNRLKFVFYEIDDEGQVYTVFEVLNSRGLEVSWFDRTKSILMGMVFDSEEGNRKQVIDEIHDEWTEIYRCIGLRLGLSVESLRVAATLSLSECPSKPLGEEDAAETLKLISEGGLDKIIATTKWLHQVTESVDKLHKDRRRNAVTGIGQARLVAVSIHLRSDLTSSEKERILDRWERVSFRIYGIMGNDARTAVGDYVRLGWRIRNKRLPSKEILSELESIGSKVSIQDAVKELRKVDCYTYWQSELLYFLNKYEEHLSRVSGQVFSNEQWNRIWEANASDSIEHILPQSDNKEYVHWLGNLTVLPPRLNSQLGKKRPVEKGESYRKTGLLVTGEVLDQLPKWGKTQIEEREDRLVKWAEREWAG
jgi:uncharacterized protein DUF262/uncharacterized protein DUF1524